LLKTVLNATEKATAADAAGYEFSSEFKSTPFEAKSRDCVRHDKACRAK
jgi:hypothetical protein